MITLAHVASIGMVLYSDVQEYTVILNFEMYIFQNKQTNISLGLCSSSFILIWLFIDKKIVKPEKIWQLTSWSRMKSLRMTNSLSVFVSGVSLMRLAEEMKQHDWLALSGSRTKCCVTYFSGKFCNIGKGTYFSFFFNFSVQIRAQMCRPAWRKVTLTL